MSVDGQHVIVDVVIPASDLSSYQYHVVDAAGARAATANHAFGLLLNSPLSGDHAPALAIGIGKIKAYGALSAGQWITVGSGMAIAAASGANTIGRMMYSVLSGSIGTARLNFLSLGYLATSGNGTGT